MEKRERIQESCQQESQVLKAIEDEPGENPELSPEKILGAAVVGIVAALAYDLGIALAEGPPLGANETLADIISGFLGGAAGEIVLELSTNNILGAGVGAFITGFVYQIIIQSLPSQEPPAEALNRKGSGSERQKALEKTQNQKKPPGLARSKQQRPFKVPFRNQLPGGKSRSKPLAWAF